jgi:CRP-like cAMP-binding protein
MRMLCIFSIVFFLGSAVLAGDVPKFLMYFLALPANVVRLYQIRNLIKKARSSAQGTLSLDWLRPFMTPRTHQKGDVLFRKGDPATEMFLTVSGKFLVTEINIEIPPERILGELGFLSPNNNRTQSVECTEDGEVLTSSYDKLRELYLESPEFGYYFLRLTSDRLLQNHARLEGLVDDAKAELAALDAATAGPAGGGGRKTLFAKLRQKAAADTGGPLEGIDIDAIRRRRAFEIVERHANYSAVGGFVPLPVANVAAIMAVLVRMVKLLSELYGTPYERNRATSIVVGLMGGVMPTQLAAVASSTFVHFVPGFNLVGLAVSSVTASAYARQVGRIMIEHFETEAELERRRRAMQPVRRRWRSIWRLRLRRRAAAPG